MSYYDNRESVVNIYHGLVERGWNCYGYKANESDPYTDYYSPSDWQGVAEKNGFILLVDVSGTHYSGYKKTKQGYTPDYEKIEKLRATINDKSASQNEKETSQKIIDNMMNKQKESTITVQEYPTFKQGNPKGSNWHIEKDGNIIAKGKGAFQCDGYLFGEYEAETMKKVNAFIDKIESKINGSEELQEVQKKIIKKVIKPIEVTDRKTLQVGDVLSFEYHGHYWVVISVNEKTFTYEILGSEKRGYQRLTNGKRYYDYMTKFEKNLESGVIKLYELKEVEEVTYKTVYKSVKRQGQQENLLPMEEVVATKEEEKEINCTIENIESDITVEVPETNEKNGITYQTGTGAKGNGIEIAFTEKPSEEVRKLMKANGYRWGGKNRSSIWWAILTDESLFLAKQIAGEGDAQEEQQELNNIEVIMNDLENVEITAEQKERIQILLNHWNNKEMAVLELIYKDNDNIILKANDKRKNVSSNIRYARIFAGGEVATGLNPKKDEIDRNNYMVIYDVKEFQKVNNSDKPITQAKNDITGQAVYSYPEIEIDDCTDEKYNIPQSIQDMEHDNSMFRTVKRDHNKEIQDLFTYYTDQVKDVISTTENEYYIYKLKSGLQRFKKNYHVAYLKYISHKSSHPSWAITGRGNLNVSRYNKGMDRQDKLMLEVANLPDEFKNYLSKYKNKIRKDKADQLKQQLQEELSQPLPELTFKTVTRDFDIYGRGTAVKTRFYECEGYSAAKLWGAWRVFKDNKEIYSTKSNGSLKDAKAYISLMIKQDQLQAV